MAFGHPLIFFCGLSVARNLLKKAFGGSWAGHLQKDSFMWLQVNTSPGPTLRLDCC